MTPTERDNHKMQVVEDTIDAHSNANVEIGLVVGGIVTRNGDCEDTWLGQDLENHLHIGSNQDAKDVNELRDHVIIQSHQFGILRSEVMLFNNGICLAKGKTRGCVIDHQPKVQRIFYGHKIRRTTFIELEEPHCVHLQDGPIIPIHNIIVRVKVQVPNQLIDYLGCNRHL
ncbi:unnamed protein product [Sphagnum balticum]